MTTACPACLTRARLLEALAGRIERLASRAGHPVRELLALPDDDLLAVTGVDGGEREAIVARARAAAASDAGGDRAGGGGAVCIHDERYPVRLRDLSDPPRALFHTGPADRLERLAAERPVAVVGSRRPSAQAEETARGLGRGLAAAQVTVVSGLAFGIDAACHWGAVEGGGTAIAVLASGADRPSPARNRGLYTELLEAGTVVSEMPWGASPWRWLFPARNRIMAALAHMTLVVEATARSGSLITTAFAEQLGRAVAAMPGVPGARLTEGNNALLRDGCIPVRDAVDVLDELYEVGIGIRQGADARARIGDDPTLGALLDGVEVGESLEQLRERSGLGAAELRAALGRLEQRGVIRRAGLGTYVAVAGG